MRADHNSELSFLDAMRYAITDQLNAFRMASTKTGTRGQQVCGAGFMVQGAACRAQCLAVCLASRATH